MSALDDLVVRAKIAACRSISQCTNPSLQICGFCKDYISVFIYEEEFKVEKGRIWIRTYALKREKKILQNRSSKKQLLIT